MVGAMRIAVGFKAHSGWAALVALGRAGGHIDVTDRRRIELIDPDSITWAKQPYHSAEGLPAESASRLVERGVEMVHRVAGREVRALVERAGRSGHSIIGCAVLVGAPMPAWTTDQILAVHMRMHKAEGVLFPSALAQAAAACHLNLVTILEKDLGPRAEKSLDLSSATRQLATLGKSVGPPWGKDQKSAALAAMIVLQEHSR
jgi:hypothetical protein